MLRGAVTRAILCGVWMAWGLSAASAADPDPAADPWAARRAKLDQRPKKIFAHYMGCYPIGRGGASWQRHVDQKARHDSERSDEYSAIGGRARGEPLLPDGVDGLSVEASADLDIRRAMRAGIDGFAFMAIAGGANNVFPVMDAMFKVCEEKDYPFEITWCLSGLDESVKAIDYILKKHGNSPKLARRDGKVLMLGYQSIFTACDPAREIFSKRHPEIKKDSPEERCSPEFLRLWREGLRTNLEERFKTPMYFQFGYGALFFGMQGKPKEERPFPETIGYLAEGFEAISAFNYDSVSTDYDAVAKAVTDKGSEWGEPMMYCYENILWGYKPRTFPFEPGSDAIRHCWENARRNQSTLIQFSTWNDYTEHTTLAPTTDIRYGVLDLNAYFVKWWKTGTPPVPERDKLYVIYPKYRHDLATYPFHNPAKWGAETEPWNKLEVLSILTAPARLRMPGRNIEWDAPAGLSWKQIPLTPGPVAVEVLRRNWTGMRRLALKLESPEPVTDRPFRMKHSMVCVSTEDEWHWKQDFGEGVATAPLRRSEYGDDDKDGLPNWFEMYYFGSGPNDWASATVADPSADPDGDGRTNLQEYLDCTNPLKAAVYKPGFVWDIGEVGGTTLRSFSPEYDRFDTPVWYFCNKLQDKPPFAHKDGSGGYLPIWGFERWIWGAFTRQWVGDPQKGGTSRILTSVTRSDLRAFGWRSPVTGTVRMSVKLNPWRSVWDSTTRLDVSPDKDRIAMSESKATASIEREGVATPLLAKEFAPHEGMELDSEPISVKAGETIYLVLDTSPGFARVFTMELEKLTVALIDKKETR